MSPHDQAVAEAFSAKAPPDNTSSSCYNRRRLDIRPTPTKTEGSSSTNSFSFGLIADVQWADTEDGQNYAKTVKRCYRGSFQTLKRAVQYWKDYNKEHQLQQDKLQFVAQLGDLIDGINSKLGTSDRSLDLALKELDRLGEDNCPSVNLVGNHELYNYNRDELAKAKWLQNGDSEYYSFTPQKGWRVIVLDPYQLAVIGYDHNKEDPRRIYAVDWVCRENPNVSPNGEPGDWFVGIDGYQRRFCPYNGGYGTKQLSWFDNELNEATLNQERVIILSHVIIHPKACGGGTMVWDYEDALNIIYKYSDLTTSSTSTLASSSTASDDDSVDGGNDNDDKNNVVVAVLCGHDHKGNYHKDEYGIHHCTFQSPLNKGTDGYAYGIMKVNNNEDDDYIEICGPKIDDLLPNVNDRPQAVITTERSFTVGNTNERLNEEYVRLPIRPIDFSAVSSSPAAAAAATPHTVEEEVEAQQEAMAVS